MGRLSPLLLVAALVTSGCRGESTDDRFAHVDDFRLTDRSGRQVSRDDLKGQVWIAAFFFTRCPGPCTKISGAMARMQHELAQYQNVRLVSFSVDPQYDSPEVLQKYGERFQADPARWYFLTGDRATIWDLSRKCFHMAVEENKDTARQAGDDVMHGTRLALVDKHGQVRGYYDVSEEARLAELRKKVAALVREK